MKIKNKTVFMVKSLVVLSIICSLTLCCTITEKPEFIGITNIQVTDTNIKTFTLSADALFKNPNDVGGSLETEGLDVSINGSEVAKLKAKSFDVPKKAEFTIPLTVAISTDSIISNKSLGGILGSLFSKQLEVQYKGQIDYVVFGYSSSYKVDQKQTVKIKF